MHTPQYFLPNCNPSAVSMGIAAAVFCYVSCPPKVLAQSFPFFDSSSESMPGLDQHKSPSGQELSFDFDPLPPPKSKSHQFQQSDAPLSTTVLPSQNGLVSFDFTRPVVSSLSPSSSLSTDLAQPLTLEHLFDGHSDSLVARAIGCAEGTRTPNGGKTWAYQGHTDPGNGVWNLGTFSWQHGATSAEDADRKQLARLRRQAIALTRQAEAEGIPWGLAEQLNALDLANQSPSAALDPGGYIERLKQAHDQGMRGSDAILWARTWSYRHPSGTKWNAPGLGNTHNSIRADQRRRLNAIEQAIAHFPLNRSHN